MILIFLASYDAYDTNPISFVTETTYLQWNTSFPSVSICQVMNQDIYWTAWVHFLYIICCYKELYSIICFSEPNAMYSALQTFISEIVFFTGSCYACSKPCEECERVNMTEAVNRVSAYYIRISLILYQFKYKSHSIGSHVHQFLAHVNGTVNHLIVAINSYQ